MIALALCLSAMLGLLVTSLSERTDTEARENPNGDHSIPVRILTLTIHDPIHIVGNAGFNNASGVVWGSGTESDPYIIEGWDINASTANGIEIHISNAHFIVRDCYIHDGAYSRYDSYGIHLRNCANGTLDSNFCSNNGDGIHFYSSNNNTLTNNTASNNRNGISLWYSSDNALASNTVSWNSWYGIYSYYSNSNTLTNNTASSNSFDGIYLVGSGDNTLAYNAASSNDQYGICLDASDSNILMCNTISNNNGYGIIIWWTTETSGSWIWNNALLHNNGATDTYDAAHIQAYDGGPGNWWNSTDGHGNYWSDWTGPDANMDGIVDLPYNISGNATAKDYYPLTTPQTPIPEFGMMPLVVMGLVAAISLTVGARRRKTH